MLWIIRSCSSLARSGRQGEAASLLDTGYENVEPLAWLELRPSVTVENSRGVRGYVDCVLLPRSELEGFYAVVDGRDLLDGHRV